MFLNSPFSSLRTLFYSHLITKYIGGKYNLIPKRTFVEVLKSTNVSDSDETSNQPDEFRTLIIPGYTKLSSKKTEIKWKPKEVPLARYKQMPVDQDWTSVWPTAETFKWSVVPFPVRQGMIFGEENDGVPPGKYANAELMKIPNFFHLTPKHIQQHCEKLKDYCTEWPDSLTDEMCDKYFPVEITDSNYVLDGPVLRDDRSRHVKLQMKVSSLNLNHHGKDKLRRLAGDRYDAKKDILTIQSERCPLKKQNKDYVEYLLTALYFESLKTDKWESDKCLEDMEVYIWEMHTSKQTLVDTIQSIKKNHTNSKEDSSFPEYLKRFSDVPNEQEILEEPLVIDYRNAVSRLHNDGEDLDSLNQYKESVRRLLFTDTIFEKDIKL